VLVVEDEEAYLDALSIGLTKEGFRVAVARHGEEALARFAEVRPDLVVLDVMLPRLSGIDVCREIRRSSPVPVIMVTARSSELDTVLGLEVGADDYVTKPYRMRELVARMRAVLRRHQPVDGPADTSSGTPTVVVGDVVVDEDRHEVTLRGEPVALTLKEFDLLALLVQNAGRALSRDVLLDRVWGTDFRGDAKTLDVHIKRVRSKIEPDPARPCRIVTIRGLGYRYERPDR
jgi:two-component system, OmpR family, response regulator RegX3